MKLMTRVFALASIITAATAGLALPSQAAPFFSAGNSANCAPTYHTTSYNNGYTGGFHSGYNTGIVPPRVASRGFGFGYNNISTKESAISRQIQAGIANGSLTRREADKLLAQQTNINQLQARLASNGLSFSDRQRLNADLARLQSQVRIQMSDNQTSGRRFW
jgi:hypothetical protein